MHDVPVLRKALDIQEYRGSHADPEVIQSYLYCYGTDADYGVVLE